MKEGWSKAQPETGLRHTPTGISLSSWWSPFHPTLKLQSCISMAVYLFLQKETFKAFLFWHWELALHTVCQASLWQLMASAKQKHSGCRGRRELLCLAGSSHPVPAGRLPEQQQNAASIAIYLLPLRRQLSHLERRIVVAKPCLEILQERTESPPWGTGLYENLVVSLQSHSWHPYTPFHMLQFSLWYHPDAEFCAKTNLILAPNLARPRFWGSTKF